jgi:hypothetical protein
MSSMAKAGAAGTVGVLIIMAGGYAARLAGGSGAGAGVILSLVCFGTGFFSARYGRLRTAAPAGGLVALFTAMMSWPEWFLFPDFLPEGLTPARQLRMTTVVLVVMGAICGGLGGLAAWITRSRLPC